ncbi:MAG: transposase [Hymenobacter sp.]
MNPGGLPTTRKKYTPAFKAECVRQVAAGARQTDVARAQGISPTLAGPLAAPGAGSKPCPAARSATKLGGCAPNSSAWKWSAIF